MGSRFKDVKIYIGNDKSWIVIGKKNKMDRNLFFIENKKLILVFTLLILLISLSTSYYGSVDIGDYSGVAKFYAGKYDAKIRSTHSHLYGFIHFPFVSLLNSFWFFKITNVLIFLALVLSVYYINKKSRKTLWIALLSPVIWYMAPWISPIAIASLFLLWAYYFINKYEGLERLRYLVYSGILIGLGWVFWDTTLYFGAFLGLSFMFDKKLNHVIVFILAIFIGLFPRLIFDHLMFNFSFFTTVRAFLAGIVHAFLGGIYQNNPDYARTFESYLLLFLSIPLGYWIMYKPSRLKNYKRSLIFLSLSLLLITINPQVRYILAIAPIMIVLVGRNINYKQFLIQSIFSLIVILLFISPYVIQAKYNIDNEILGVDFGHILRNGFDIQISKEFPQDLIKKDLEEISEEYKYKTFLVGNKPDDYRILANAYWGDNVEEFVSIQDYDLFFANESVIFEKKLMPKPNIGIRRQIWIAGGINKNENDETDYESIEFLITIGNSSTKEEFELVKNYEILSLWKKNTKKSIIN